jgi:hypothetical protein
MAESMPELQLKSKKPHNFWMKYPNPPRKSSLESSNPYLPLHKVSNALEHYCIYSALLKSTNSQNVLLRCLGINASSQVRWVRKINVCNNRAPRIYFQSLLELIERRWWSQATMVVFIDSYVTTNPINFIYKSSLTTALLKVRLWWECTTCSKCFVQCNKGWPYFGSK